MQIGLKEIWSRKDLYLSQAILGRCCPAVGLRGFGSLPRASISPSVKRGEIRAPRLECHGSYLHQSGPWKTQQTRGHPSSTRQLNKQ